MKKLYFTLIIVALYGCSITKDGIIINAPTVPSISVCANVATDADVQLMVDKIESQAFKDEKLSRARLVTKNYCFVSSQVISIMEAFTFEDNKLTMAKELYDQTTDKANYDTVVDALTYKSDRDELIDYISQNP